MSRHRGALRACRSFAAALALLAASATAAAQGWEYESQVERMDGSPTKLATVRSTNASSPATTDSSDNQGQLVIRQRKVDGLKVLFSIQKGQLACGYGNCAVLVRFNDSPPIRFNATKPDDLSSNALFIDNERRFIEQATKATTIRVAATFDQAGSQVIEFSTPKPLAWSLSDEMSRSPPKEAVTPGRWPPGSRR